MHVGRGRPPRSTFEQRSEIFRLADAGLGHGAIAERVFGDSRFRLRVLRLLRRRADYDVAALDPSALEELVRAFRSELSR